MDTRSLDEKRAELATINSEIGNDRSQRVLRDGAFRKLRDLRRLTLERELAAAEGAQYAEDEPLSITIGDEWHVVSNSGETILLCGDASNPESAAIQFERVAEVAWRTNDADLDHGPLLGRGLDVYGLFRVRNSEWRKTVIAAVSEHLLNFDNAWWSELEHFIVRGKGGELSCLAKNYRCREIHEPIESIRRQAAFWRNFQ